MSERIGQQLGNYQLIQLLGKGHFAEVYLAGHIHLGILAAVKVLNAPLMDVDTFRTEARILAHLIHPSIVRVLEFGIEDPTPFLVMIVPRTAHCASAMPKERLFLCLRSFPMSSKWQMHSSMLMTRG